MKCLLILLLHGVNIKEPACCLIFLEPPSLGESGSRYARSHGSDDRDFIFVSLATFHATHIFGGPQPAI